MLSPLSSPTPSKPVVIPTRTQTPRPRRSRNDGDNLKPTSCPPHDANAIPPSMAALMAVASVQNPSSFTMRRSLSGMNIKKDGLSLDDFRYTLSSSSPKSWSILQSPPDDSDGDNREHEGDSSSITSSSTIAPLSSFRSLSSDSMPSLDMELDLESPDSPGPPTPAYRVRSNYRREKRQFHRLSLSESDHPLTPPSQSIVETPPSDEEKTKGSLPTNLVGPSMSPRSPFKSNLTASIRLLKSAARTLSNIAPKPYIPDPVPRQNLNGSTQPIASRFLPPPAPLLPRFANIDALPADLHVLCPVPNLPPSSASIQLMPYVPSPILGSAFATAPPVFLPAANPMHESLEKKMTSPRPREPRENSDFLRVVVLEMNMRRIGKLNGEGRARIWLGPRTDGEEREEGDVLEGVIGADRDVEEQVLQDEGELRSETQGGPASSDEPSIRLPTVRKTTSEIAATRKQIPSRWVGMTP
ncbi:hypothetical protein MMC10_011115 [Thelotrema lepadinum]|nr:hypothetical protein [Thelotrema lepadinum]